MKKYIDTHWKVSNHISYNICHDVGGRRQEARGKGELCRRRSEAQIGIKKNKGGKRRSKVESRAPKTRKVSKTIK